MGKRDDQHRDPRASTLWHLASARAQLAELGSRGDKHAVMAAAVVEALEAAIYPRDHDRWEQIIDAMGRAARAIRYAIDGATGRPAEYSHLANAMRAALKPLVLIEKDGRRVPRSAGDLAFFVEMAARGCFADAIFPRTGTSEERRARYEKVIEPLLAERIEWPARLLAERVIESCAKADGFKKKKRLYAE